MRLTRLCLAAAALVFSAAAIHAESKNVADYPLRLHIFNHSQTTFYHRDVIDETKGEGRANLFENGEARGVDFSYECSEKVKASFGFETYPARWKKPGRELTVLFPVFGKAGNFFTCTIKTDVKDFAYVAHDGRMGYEPVDAFKHWMVMHNYDPEHGKDLPTKAETAPPGDAQPAPTHN
ncbi:MAG TPA: hypothetical protein VFA99_09630 [Acidobacteriaceae bacterium]|nr:hypothetical protein [Acidobacteriaceae bacterium]